MRFRCSIIVLAVWLFGCGKPKPLNITPRDPTVDEIKHALRQLPEGFRAALPDAASPTMDPANAGRLDLHVWAFDFDGGPFDMIIETIGAESGGINWREPRLRCDAERGRLLIRLLPRESSKMAQELRDKFRSNKPPVPNLSFGLDANDRSILRQDSFGNPDKPVVPLWFGWKEADVHESKTPVTLKAGEAGNLLRIEATEKDVANPRKIILSLQAVK